MINIEKAFEPQAQEKPSDKELLTEAIQLIKAIQPQKTGLFNKANIQNFLKKVQDEGV